MSRSILKQLMAKRSMHRLYAGANGKPLPSKFLAQLAASLGLTGAIALVGMSSTLAIKSDAHVFPDVNCLDASYLLKDCRHKNPEEDLP